MANVRPLSDRILVKRLEEERTSPGGIVIPDSATEKPIKGKVIAVGKGKILVDYHSTGEGWVLTVRDTGIGMPANLADAKPGLGTGIVEALAKQLGAEVTVAAAGPGTIVSVARS